MKEPGLSSHSRIEFKRSAGADNEQREPSILDPGFTLIELLVVMAIISTLASMTLPSLSRAKEKARITTCINNFHQIGIALKMYLDDFGFRFPPLTILEPYPGSASGASSAKDTLPAIGGFDPIPELLKWVPSASKRPLFPYLQPSQVFRCPLDKGQLQTYCPGDRHNFKPSNWETVGCSYQYHGGMPAFLAGGGFKQCPTQLFVPLSAQTESWVPDPVRFILLHEPPARIYGFCGVPEWHQWHYSRQRTDIPDPVYAPQQFISPVLFVDGHAAIHNFSKSLSKDPYFPYEPTKDWIWYKPAERRTAAAQP